DPRARSRRAQAGRDLEDASGIRADDHIRRCIEDLSHFVLLELARYLGMGQVVDAGAAATAFRVVDVEKGHALDRPQERAWLRSDALAVREVTCVLVDDADRSPGARRKGLHDLADIADPGGKDLGAVRPEGVPTEDVAVVLQ